jgi:hypothetical protein
LDRATAAQLISAADVGRAIQAGALVTATASDDAGIRCGARDASIARQCLSPAACQRQEEQERRAKPHVRDVTLRREFRH